MRRASLLTIFLVVLVDLMGFGIVLPNLQLYGHDFGISNYFVLTLIGAVYSFFQFLFAPILGRWSDRIGRRPVLLISQGGTVIGYLVLFGAHFFLAAPAIAITLLFSSRVIDGISGGNISTASAYVADITKPEDRAKGLGVIGAAFGIGFILGPLIGGFTARFLGLQYVPLVAMVFSIAAFLMTMFTLPESLNPEARPKGLRRFSFNALKHALSRPVIGVLILIFFVNGFAFAGMEQTLSLLIQVRLFEPAKTHSYAHLLAETQKMDSQASFYTGILFFFIGFIIALIQGRGIHSLTKKFGEAKLVIVGPLLIAVGLIIIGLPIHLWPWRWLGFGLGCGLLAAGSSIFTPSLQSLISRHASESEQGEVLGANQGMASLARALGPILAGLLFEYVTPATPYFVSAGLCIVVALWTFGLRRRLRPPVGTIPEM